MNQPTCPVCHTPHQAHETICNNCGFVFAVHPNAANSGTSSSTPVLHPSACAYCGNIFPKDARFCVICGKPTFVSYKPPEPGQTLANGRYSIQKPLSKGGMGAIYLATDHETFQRTVVIKAMLDYFDPTNKKEVQEAHHAFEQEARTLSQLHHPAIPQIYTHFQEGTHNYIVMEYIEGRNLESGLTRTDPKSGKKIAGHAYPTEHVIRWGIALCRVLEYLVSRKPYPVVHHDIKPANVLLDSNNDIRLVDFGTAKARLQKKTGGNVGLQKTGIFGTQGYAPPEQYRGQSEPRSDVYALAATLYHLATDDDPSDHPFTFSRLEQLRGFGTVLQAALDRNIEKRPTATRLRQQFEMLFASARPFQTPNGSDVENEVELARWCEQHWEDAARWLYRSLPDLVEQLWMRSDLAEELRDIVRRNRNRNAGLDEALALLNPQHFGNERPKVACSHTLLDFGKLAPRDEQVRSFTVSNTSKRFVMLNILHPYWLQTKRTSISLIPGKTSTLTFTTALQQERAGSKLRETLVLEDVSGNTWDIDLIARVSRLESIKQWLDELRQSYSIWVAMLLGMAVGWFGGWNGATMSGLVIPLIPITAALGCTLTGVAAILLVTGIKQTARGTGEMTQKLIKAGIIAGVISWSFASAIELWLNNSLSLMSSPSWIDVAATIGFVAIMMIVGAFTGVWFGIATFMFASVVTFVGEVVGKWRGRWMQRRGRKP